MPKKDGTKAIIDPFVRVEVREPLRSGGFLDEGEENEGEERKESVENAFKSKVIQDNGFNPVWNENHTFTFEEFENAMLVFKVYDEDKLSTTLLGQRALSLSCMREGYRVVKLLDRNFDRIQQGYLFCHFEFDFM